MVVEVADGWGGCRESLPPLISARKINNAGNQRRKVAAVKQQWLLISIDRRAASFPRRPQQKHSSAATAATCAGPLGRISIEMTLYRPFII